MVMILVGTRKIKKRNMVLKPHHITFFSPECIHIIREMYLGRTFFLCWKIPANIPEKQKNTTSATVQKPSLAHLFDPFEVALSLLRRDGDVVHRLSVEVRHLGNRGKENDVG